MIEEMLEEIKNIAKQKSLQNDAMSAREIIHALKEYDKDYQVVILLNKPIYNDDYDVVDSDIIKVSSSFDADSWRGSYNLPAIGYEVNENFCTVKTAIENLRHINGMHVEGYKGGEYVLDHNDPLFVANYGSSNDCIAIVDIKEKDGVVEMYTMYDMY